MKRFFLLPLLAMLALSGLARAEIVPEEVTIWAPDGLEIKADLYLPEGDGPFPGAVMIHGGGCEIGSKTSHVPRRLAQALAELGFVALSVNYRFLDQGGTFPNNVIDCKCAVRYLRSRAEELRLDPDFIVTGGDSAGGYLAGMVAGTGDIDSELFAGGCPQYDGFSDSVQASALIFGPLDFKAASLLSLLTVGAKLMGENAIRKTDPRLIPAAPVTYAERFGLVIIIQGLKDTVVVPQHAYNMFDALEQAGVHVELYEYPDEDHAFWNEDSQARVIDFFLKARDGNLGEQAALKVEVKE